MRADDLDPAGQSVEDRRRSGEEGDEVEASRSAWRIAWRNGAAEEGTRTVPEEMAVALTYDGSAHAVMMATPLDLDDFALGFSLSEGIVAAPGEIESLEIIALDRGIEARMRLKPDPGRRHAARRRAVAGPVGCGLCGIESLDEALKPVHPVTGGVAIDASAIVAGMEQLAARQPLNRLTRAVHAAAFMVPDRGIVAVREDVGRHNALDKLVGALAREKIDGASGVVLLTSRVSVEMVQKSAALGAAILAAVSVPTALAIDTADAAGVTLAAVVRADGLDVFTHPGRLVFAKG